VFVRLLLIIKAGACSDKMAQIAMASQVQRNSQRGVGTACQSRVGSHSQGCHWRKRLESCIERERGRGGTEDEGERETGVRHIEKDRRVAG